MGTITFYEIKDIGAQGDGQAPIPKMARVKRTRDASTSTTAEYIDLDSDTTALRVVCDVTHRASVDNNVADAGNYWEVGTTEQDFGVNGGERIYYRLDA